MDLEQRLSSFIISQKLKSKCLGIVLSSSKNFNIGQDKVNAAINDKTQTAYAMGLISEIGVNSICISKNIENKKSFSNFISYDSFLGEIFSVLKRAEYKKFETALILPVDMPQTGENILESLFYNMSDNQAVCYKENIFPLLLSIDPRTIKLMDYILHNHNAKKNKLNHFLSKVKTNYLSLPQEIDDYSLFIKQKESFIASFSKTIA